MSLTGIEWTGTPARERITLGKALRLDGKVFLDAGTHDVGSILPGFTFNPWLGHSSTAVTQRYAHLAPDHLSARVGAALRGPTGSPSAGSAVSSPNAQKPLENTGRAMQESNLRPSASETDAPRAKTPCPPTNRTPADPPRTHDRVAVAVLEVAARGEPLPRGLVAELARAALACGVASADVARMWVAGPTQARAVVEVAVMVAATAADEAAMAAGE